MNLDIRLPIGGLFAVVGLLVLIYGIITNGDAMYARSLNINVNIWWGLVMLVFGALMLGFGLRRKPALPTNGQPPRSSH
jgi:uncharacterized membrane protein